MDQKQAFEKAFNMMAKGVKCSLFRTNGVWTCIEKGFISEE